MFRCHPDTVRYVFHRPKVDWHRAALRVESPKTARHGKPTRVTPIVPELLALLDAAHHTAPEGAEFILPALRRYSNPSTPMLRAMRDSGTEQWPRIFHALRASPVTDLAESHPLADVAAWMGRIRGMAAKHFLRPTDASFASATSRILVTPVVTTMRKPW